MCETKKHVTCGVRVLIINSNNEVLLGRRSDHKDKFYAAPGGHLEYGESFEECAVRELYEELNIRIEENEVKYLTTLNVV
jgi:8-oxo-dGTP diphosphatase